MRHISSRRPWRSHLAEPEPFAKSEQYELDPDIVEILAEPASREGSILDAIRKAGGDESVEKAAAAAARAVQAIRDAHGGSIPADVRKAMRAQMLADDVDDTEDEDEEDQARSDADEILKAEPAKPASTRTAAESWLEVAKIESRAADSMAERTLDTMAASLRRRHPNLTEAQAISKALDQNPDLYERMRRHDLRKSGYPIGEPEPLAGPLQTAADRLRADDPTLTPEQAVAKALENNPSLYTIGGS